MLANDAAELADLIKSLREAIRKRMNEEMVFSAAFGVVGMLLLTFSGGQWGDFILAFCAGRGLFAWRMKRWLV